MDDYNSGRNLGSSSAYNDNSTGGGFDGSGRGSGGMGSTGYGDDSFASSGRDALGSTGRDGMGGAGRDTYSGVSGRGADAGLGRDTMGIGGRGSGMGDDSFDNTAGGRTGGVRDNTSFARDMTTGREDPRAADTNYAGAPIRSGPFSGTDADTYGSTGTGRGLGGSSRVTDTDRGNREPNPAAADYIGSGNDSYGGNNTENRRGSGNDSTLGKIIEKVGDMTKNQGMVEKGRDMREKKGFETDSFDDPNVRTSSNNNY